MAIKSFPTWKETFGDEPTDLEFYNTIRPLDKLNTVWYLARINLRISQAHRSDDDRDVMKVQQFLAPNLIEPQLLTAMQGKYGSEWLSDRQPFHPLQILTLMKEVILRCNDAVGERPDRDRPAAYRLGRALIMTNDRLFSCGDASAIHPSRSVSMQMIALQLQVGPDMEINNPPDIVESIVRNDNIFRKLRNGGDPDIGKVFYESAHISLEEYVEHVLWAILYFSAVDPQEQWRPGGSACISTGSFFGCRNEESARAFWKLELQNISDTETAMRQVPPSLPVHRDFAVFRTKAFLEVCSGSAIPVHMGFLQEKLEAGMFWTISNSLKSSAEPENERKRLHRMWGEAFQSYVSELLLKSFKGTQEKFFSFPKFDNNAEESFDGMVRSGECWVVMEYKGGLHQP